MKALMIAFVAIAVATGAGGAMAGKEDACTTCGTAVNTQHGGAF